MDTTHETAAMADARGYLDTITLYWPRIGELTGERGIESAAQDQVSALLLEAAAYRRQGRERRAQRAEAEARALATAWGE